MSVPPKEIVEAEIRALIKDESLIHKWDWIRDRAKEKASDGEELVSIERMYLDEFIRQLDGRRE